MGELRAGVVCLVHGDGEGDQGLPCHDERLPLMSPTVTGSLEAFRAGCMQLSSGEERMLRSQRCFPSCTPGENAVRVPEPRTPAPRISFSAALDRPPSILLDSWAAQKTCTALVECAWPAGRRGSRDLVDRARPLPTAIREPRWASDIARGVSGGWQQMLTQCACRWGSSPCMHGVHGRSEGADSGEHDPKVDASESRFCWRAARRTRRASHKSP